MNRPYIICHMTMSIDGKPLFFDSVISECELIKAESINGNVVLNYKKR